ncbi:MAG TPA: GatB/YqeY domain-containing protein [Myxococcaceae bacterium]|nr:GatB/YqeY domain-containing protein [Myxococcaceae bacterium]
MASVKERIDADLKDAMRQKNELTLGVLRMLKSAVKYKEVEPGAQPLDDAGVFQVISTQVKQRREAAEQYRAGNRTDLAEKEEREIAVLQSYLPAQASSEQIAQEVKDAIAQVGAQGPKDMGAVMKVVGAKLKGRAEGKVISDAVKAALAAL